MNRAPAVADSFYPGTRAGCAAELAECIPADVETKDLPLRPLGGVVPHAGWFFSGRVAGRVIATIAARRRPHTVVIFGAVHSWRVKQAALFDAGHWQMPTGDVAIDESLAQRVGRHAEIVIDPGAHDSEHSIEVQVPFIQHLLPDAKILPILVPPSEQAARIGQLVAQDAQQANADAVFLGSTDLTHYGPRYGFTPMGSDAAGVAWAKDVNDRRFIDLMLALDADRIVDEARANHNACGGGAVAATLSACRESGATKGWLLEHTTSNDVMQSRGMRPSADSVGYAGVIFG